MSNLIEISSNLGLYLTSLSPQIKNGSLQYYFSGSLAAMITANAENIAEIELDEFNNVSGERPLKSITKEQREKMAKFSRKLGLDIDIVDVNGNLYPPIGFPERAKLDAPNVIKNVPQVLDLMSWNPKTGGIYYIDKLEADRKITYHPVAKVKIPNGEFYVTAPPEQLAHKLSETIWLRMQIAGDNFDESQKAKYEKDIKDLSSMFYGYKDLYDKDEFLNRIYLALNEKDGALFSIHNLMYNRENSMKAQKILAKLIREISDDSVSHLANITNDQSSKEISEFFVALIDKRKSEVEKIIHTEETPLQQRESELSSLEAKVKQHDEEIAGQNEQEGKDIGEI